LAGEQYIGGSASDRQCKTTGFHLPDNLREFFDGVAFERARAGRASVSALIVEIERHRNELEKELSSVSG
jgi:hypothetical protein